MSSSYSDLLLHGYTDKRIRHFIKHPSQVLLITGPVGSGKPTLATAVAAELLKVSANGALGAYPFFIRLRASDAKHEISIEAIRDLIHKLKLKTPGSGSVRRIVLIEDAHEMSSEAQNALLKTLEEPSAETLFILTAPSNNTVLSTIASRAQQIHIQPSSLAAAHHYFSEHHSGPDIEAAWQISQGAAGLLHALLIDDKAHPLKEAVEQAKLFLSKTRYERFLTVEEWGRSRPKLTLQLAALARLLGALNVAALKRENPAQVGRILVSRRLVYELQTALEVNTAPRLAALQLLMNLSV